MIYLEKLIGILAGMGPRSTAPFIDMVIDECQRQYGAKYDEDFPPLMIYSLPTPFFIDRPLNHDLMKEVIVKGLQKLEATGVDFIAVPCNSAHIYFHDLLKAVHTPLLNIVEETLRQLPPTKQKIALLATETTLHSEIYQQGISAAGHEFIFHNEWQEKINNLIQMIKTAQDNLKIITIWKELIEDIQKNHIQSIIMACTDLNVALSRCRPEIKVIDSAQALAQAVVKKYLDLK